MKGPYRDIMYDDFNSGGDSRLILATPTGISSAKFKTTPIQSTAYTGNFKYIVDSYKKLIKKKKEFIKIVLPPEINESPIFSDENSFNKVSELKIETIEVDKNNTLTMEKLNQQKIRQVQFLHSLALNKKEFEHLLAKFWHYIIHKKIDIDEFGMYVLGLREILFITKDEKFDLKNVNDFHHLKSLYCDNYKYIIFSQDHNWRGFILSYLKAPIIAAQINCTTFINENFTDKELKKILVANFPENPSYYDKMIQWIKKKGSLLYILDLMKSYHKNKDLFLSYEIDFNTFKVNNDKELTEFEDNLRNVNVYKIFSKLLQRLDSSKRQEVKSHNFLFSDYFNLCKDVYSRGISNDRLEPVLKKIHTYKDASYLLNALKSIITDDSLYHLYEKASKTNGAKVVLFDENEQIMIVRISKSKALDALGSRIWCIYGRKDSFRRYTFFRRFYIYYDAKQNEQNDRNYPTYMIGFTISIWNKIVYAHDKMDRNLKGSNYCAEIFKKYKKYFKI